MRWLAVVCICSLAGSLATAAPAKESDEDASLRDGPFLNNGPADQAVPDPTTPDKDPEDWKPRRKRGHMGLSVGRARLNMPCIEGLECRRNGRAVTLYAGGALSKRWGFEFAYMRMSNMEHAGNAVRVRGLNASLVGEVPLLSRLQLTGRIGTNFARTHMDQVPNGVDPSGTAHGFGLSYGAGLNWGVSENWTASADWGRHDFKFVTGRDTVDTTTVSLRYRY